MQEVMYGNEPPGKWCCCLSRFQKSICMPYSGENMVHFLILFVFFLWWVFSPSLPPNWHQFTRGYANTGLWVIRAVIQPPRDKNHFGSCVKLHHHCLDMPGLCLMVVIYSASSQGVVCVHFVIAPLAQWESPRFSELPFVWYETYSHWQWSQGQFFIFSWNMMIYVSIRAVCLGSSLSAPAV